MRSLQDELSRYAGALALEKLFPRTLRKRLSRILLFITGVFAFAGIFEHVAPIVPVPAHVFVGVALVCGSAYLVVALLSAYWNSLYFWGITRIGFEEDAGEGGITYEIAEIIKIAPDDITTAFFFSTYGGEVAMRAGLTSEQLAGFLRSPHTPLAAGALEVPLHTCMTFEHLVSFIYTHDVAFKEFLFAAGVRENIFFGATTWVSRLYHEAKHKERWWGRDMLGKTRGIGSEFSFGVAFELKRFLKDLETSTVFSVFGGEMGYAEGTITKVEQILSRAKEANVLLVAEPGVGEMDMLATLARGMEEGTAVHAIEGKHMALFDAEGFVATYGTKQQFEYEFMYLLSEAASAGNLIFVMQNIFSFFRNAESLGVDLEELMDPYLSGSGMQFIGVVDPGSYHQYLEMKPRLMQRFATVLVEAPPLQGTVRVLEDIAPLHEMRNGFVFTYAALHSIAEGAERYIVEGVMPDKAVDLLVEISSAYRSRGVVNEDMVAEFIRGKTGIPMGHVSAEERDTLTHLEETLHRYVVGQNSAIDAISDAMRRARADVSTKMRPMGSFLFLGPTGVGKTETAKALARVFFGDEHRMLRIDMSEYNGPDALARLMGTATTSGTLPSMLHEHPYGVLLLDEFEKGAREVHDLFLQILDEGVFTDGRGQKINARNAIIIATSNAGSDMLFEMAHQGLKPQEHKDDIIAHVVERGIYRPELINRFDGTIIFEPLTKEELHHIARLLLKGLAERMHEKGYVLSVSEDLVEVLVERGYDPAFGVRPMRRAMQDVVEAKIAEKIIAGGLRPGDTIALSREDLV